MSDDAKTIIKRKEALATKRSNWVNWWQDIAYRVMPSAATFTVDGPEGVRRTERQFSGRPVIANERFAAVMDDLLTPRNQIWHMLEPEDEEIAEAQDVKVYLEKLNKLLFAQRYRPKANFAGQKSQGYLSIGAFGNSCMFIGDDVGVGPHYISIPLKEVLWAQNHQGVIDTLYRDFKMEARQAAQRFGEKNLPERITKELGPKGDPFKEFEFIHCVSPNEERIESRKDYRGMAYSSYYLAVADKQIIENSGFPVWPFAIGRYMLAPNETYARGPAMACWGAILTLGEEKKSILRAGQREVEPPLLLSDDGALDAFNMRNGALNYGTLTDQGTPLVQPLKTGANIPLGLELMQIEGMEIDDAFLVSVFNILQDENIQTATQVMQIIQQKAAVIAPVMGRQATEDLGPMIDREIQIAAAQADNRWILEDMPQALADAGGLIKTRYTSPMARAMRAQDGVAIMRAFEALGQAAQIDPTSTFVLDIPESFREVSDIFGVPAHLLRDDKTVKQMQADHNQQNQTNQALAVAPNVSTAVLNAAKAEQIRTGA